MSNRFEGLDRYLGRFSGTFDVEHDDVAALDPEGVVVAVVVCKRVGANEKNDQRTGEDTVTYVLKPVEFSVIQDVALARALRRTDAIVEPRVVQLTLPFAEANPSDPEAEAFLAHQAEMDDVVVYEPEDEDVFVPPAHDLPRRPSVGGALKNDPVLARFVNGGDRP